MGWSQAPCRPRFCLRRQEEVDRLSAFRDTYQGSARKVIQATRQADTSLQRQRQAPDETVRLCNRGKKKKENFLKQIANKECPTEYFREAFGSAIQPWPGNLLVRVAGAAQGTGIHLSRGCSPPRALSPSRVPFVRTMISSSLPDLQTSGLDITFKSNEHSESHQQSG